MNKHTKQWLDNQPTWHEKDVAFLVSVALCLGIVIGWLIK